uniref:Uncharacterized protein n=1 Tax=Oryza meridionalis TaxID=40149 RepID=A0A0E0CXI1_9ORYZ
MTTVGNEENQNNENVADNDVDPTERETAKASSSGEHDRERGRQRRGLGGEMVTTSSGDEHGPTEKNQLTLFIVFPNGEADVLHEDALGRKGGGHWGEREEGQG